MRRLLSCVAATALALALAGCSSDGRTDAATAGTCGFGGVDVTGPDELADALADAEPGDEILLGPGTYDGPFGITRSGTADAPITLCGPRDAVLDGGTVDHGYGLHLDGASYWTVRGITVTHAQKGVVLDGSSHVEIADLLVEEVGDEGIHLRAGSSHDVVRDNVVRRTGLREPDYGEGIYVGTAESNWCDLSDCEPDRSDHNEITGNTVRDTTAEAVDIKEGTTGGLLSGNDLSGPGTDAADSVVDVKGNRWTVRGNTLRASAADAIQVHVVVSNWGRANRFVRNSFQLSVPGGFAVNVVGEAQEASNVVACGQRVTPEAHGELSNVACR
ncbi:right-handed parallel beta-helix repeat-containing protein [Nocardioides mangrovi]|uniref:Right-handed parallel beta-helix repeat-containing protein n=1 Tax=Nocardioides mangrovi TaxID=2874580 RepID=A0ABS7UGU0_9ACTN|nr:right-handed parallel beta-helix repeat-containing protein [Nocardioides mangrovi]MBZ5740221.1 right-handed parallel beta-helix repeat-containing protein [Nocardioides mangrovi]